VICKDSLRRLLMEPQTFVDGCLARTRALRLSTGAEPQGQRSLVPNKREVVS
jgi:hypothetical protein